MGASTEHQMIIGNLYYHFRKIIEKRNEDLKDDNNYCKVEKPVMLLAPYNLSMENDIPKNPKYAKRDVKHVSVIEPDLIIAKIGSRSLNISKKSAIGTPEMIIEVLSPATRDKDLDGEEGKKKTYEYNRVPEYWIIDPEDKSLMINILDEDNRYTNPILIKLDDENELSYSREFPFLRIKLEEIFSIEEVWN